MNNSPTTWKLVESYLTLHFKGTPCAVFFDPLGDGSRVTRLMKLLNLSRESTVELVSAFVHIHPYPLDALPKFVNDLDEDIYGYVAAWDGAKIITENT